jgi:hypothetical protein
MTKYTTAETKPKIHPIANANEKQNSECHCSEMLGLSKAPGSANRITSSSQGLTPDFTKIVHGKIRTEPAHPNP